MVGNTGEKGLNGICVMDSMDFLIEIQWDFMVFHWSC